MAANIPVVIRSASRLENTPASLLRFATRWRWPIWIAAILLLYHPIFQTRPVFDDMAHVEFAAQHGWQLLQMGPFFFRPFERMLIGVSWMLCGDDFWLVRLAALGIFVLQVGLVHDLAARIVAPQRTAAPWLIALLFLLHPMHVTALGKIDTFSEDIAALFGLLTVRFAIIATQVDVRQQTALRNALLAALTVFLGMLSKESFAGLAAITPVLFAVATGISGRSSRRILAYLVAAEGAAAIAYSAIRLTFGFPLTGAHITAARYELQFGTNVLRNVAAELIAISFPGNTLDLFVHFNLTHLLISWGLVVGFVTLFHRPLLALLRELGRLATAQDRMTVIVLLAAVAAMFPTCLIPEMISENQTALPLPFVLLFVLACPLREVWEPSGDSRTKAYATCLAGIAVAWMAMATADKVLAAREASIRAYRIGDQIVASYQEHPLSRLTVCFARSLGSDPKKYSIFSMPDDLAAFFQLYRLRLKQPAPVVEVLDLRLNDLSASQHCEVSIESASSVVRQ